MVFLPSGLLAEGQKKILVPTGKSPADIHQTFAINLFDFKGLVFFLHSLGRKRLRGYEILKRARARRLVSRWPQNPQGL
jgi:hypothetical protein